MLLSSLLPKTISAPHPLLANTPDSRIKSALSAVTIKNGNLYSPGDVWFQSASR